MKRLGVLVLLGVLVVGCQDRRTLTAPPGATAPPGGIVAAISDGAHDGGNPHFYFLPPLVEKPDLHERDGHRSHRDIELGAFNPKLRPVVRVFPLPGGGADGCTFAGTPVYEHVAAVERRAEHYDVDWNTRASRLVPGSSYRICVFSSGAGRSLGFLDVLPVTRGMRLPRTHDTYVFQDDQTLPIKFRVEVGALCAPDALECAAAAAVTSAGGAVTLPSAHAGVAIPPGAVGAGDVVTIVVEQQSPPYVAGTAAECLPTDYGLVQTKGCYHFRTEPANYQFLTNVRMEACVDPGDLDPNSLALFKYSGETLEQLPWADPTLLDCTGFVALNADRTNAPASLAATVWQGARLLFANPFAPRPLFAATVFGTPKGLGGLAGSFSDVGGAVAAEAGLLPDLTFAAEYAPTIVGSTFDPWQLRVDVNVQNVGDGSADNFKVNLELWLNADVSTYVTTFVSGPLALGPHSSVTVPFAIPCSLLGTGNYYVKAEAVNLDVIGESDPDNNVSGNRYFYSAGSSGSGYCGS